MSSCSLTHLQLNFGRECQCAHHSNGDVPTEIVINGFDLINATTFTWHAFFMISIAVFLFFFFLNFFLETESHITKPSFNHTKPKMSFSPPASQILIIGLYYLSHSALMIVVKALVFWNFSGIFLLIFR